jgi:hypothetical protein
MEMKKLNSEFFFSNYVGNYPYPTDRERNITQAMIDHLYESKVTSDEILDVFSQCANDKIISPKNLPNSLWQKSITLKDVWYYHHELQLRSKDNKVDVINGRMNKEPFYVEIKSKYTIKDLFDYALNNLGSSFAQIADRKRDSGSLAYLVGKYDKLSGISGLDFVLCLIDRCRDKNNYITNILDIEINSREVLEELSFAISEAKQKKANRVIWRFDAK